MKLLQLSVIAVCMGASLCVAQSPATATTKEKRMSYHAAGPFDVKLTPQSDAGMDPLLGRMTIDKQLHGELEATSKGQMLAAARLGYVAIEKVTGTLAGRKGSFFLQHNATMENGKPNLSIIVVPDSGTDELKGLAGNMRIVIAEGGAHSYEFDYTLPPGK